MPTTAATKLAPEQQEQLMRVFDMIDRNGGGSVTQKELKRFFETTMKRNIEERELEDIMSEITMSEHGTVGFDFERFCELMTNVGFATAKPEDLAVKAFAALDPKGQGFVPVEELVPIMVGLTAGKGQTRLGEEPIRKMLNSGCKDGKVTLADLTKILADDTI